MTALTAVVLAGGTCSPDMVAATGVTNRALVELLPGKTMLSYVLDALQNAACISEILVVGDVPRSTRYTVLAPQAGFLQNLTVGVQAAPAGCDRVLIVTSDIPFITAEAVDDFVDSALACGADFCYPVIPMDLYRKTFVAMKRTTLKIAEGEFTGGNIMLLSRGYVIDHRQTIDDAYAARKDVFRLGKMLGWSLLMRLILSQTLSPRFLDLASLERGVSSLLGHGAVARAIVTAHPSLGTDIDKPEDVEAAKGLLGAAD